MVNRYDVKSLLYKDVIRTRRAWRKADPNDAQAVRESFRAWRQAVKVYKNFIRTNKGI